VIILKNNDGERALDTEDAENGYENCGNGSV
jgi:hypothetical protein